MARAARHRGPARVVSLREFKARQAEAAPPPARAPLPLFDGEPAPANPAPPGRTRPPARDLSDREVSHRKRMLAFLRASAE